LTEDTVPYLFLNLSQSPSGEATLLIAGASDPSALAAPVRQLLKQRDAVVLRSVTLREFMQFSVFANRMAVQLVGLLAGLGMLLAAVGLYGIISYLVGRRTHEIGVRVALGASQRVIVRLFLARGIVLALTGIVLGLAAAWALSRAVGTLLYGVRARDPFTFTAASVLLLLVAAAATYLPARRAARIDPMTALRAE
jgi:ABC-type antimicrobial peptide transport system permease subunit